MDRKYHHAICLGLAIAALANACSTAIAQAVVQPKKFALLVGVNKYEHAEMNRPLPLEFAEADVKELAQFLREAGYEVIVLLGPRATKEAIDQAVGQLKSKGNSDGVALVGLAGHGVQFEQEEDAFFCPYNATMRQSVRNGRVVSNRDGQPIIEPDPASCVKLTSIVDQFLLSPAGTRILLADCCRSDPSSGRGRGVGSGIKTNRLPGNTAVMLSCSHGQRSWEDPKWGHGAFFYHVLKGLRNGHGTVSELNAYLENNVQPDVKSTLKDAPEQDPYSLINGRRLDFRISGVIDSLIQKCAADLNRADPISLYDTANDILARQPGNAPARFYRSYALSELGEFDQALVDLQYLKSKDFDTRCRLLEATIYASQYRFAESRKLIKGLEGNLSTGAIHLWEIAHAEQLYCIEKFNCVPSKEMLASRKKVYENLDRSDRSTRAVLERVRLKSYFDDLQDADISSLLKLEQIPTVLAELSMAEIKRNNLAAARNYVDKALALIPQKHKKLRSQALTFRAMAYDPPDWQKVVADCNRALEIDPENTEAFSQRGVGYYYGKKYADAIKDFTSVLEYARKEESPFEMAWAFGQIGANQARLGKLDDAKQEFRHAIKLYENNVFALAWLAELEFDAGNMQAAKTLVEQGLLLNPDYEHLEQTLNRLRAR